MAKTDPPAEPVTDTPTTDAPAFDAVAAEAGRAQRLADAEIANAARALEGHVFPDNTITTGE